jgi:hypothetical protein
MAFGRRLRFKHALALGDVHQLVGGKVKIVNLSILVDQEVRYGATVLETQAHYETALETRGLKHCRNCPE